KKPTRTWSPAKSWRNSFPATFSTIAFCVKPRFPWRPLLKRKN
ncbi:uncharacterized protein METZ01_LOCUS381333, partial [marine metagenome]